MSTKKASRASDNSVSIYRYFLVYQLFLLCSLGLLCFVSFYYFDVKIALLLCALLALPVYLVTTFQVLRPIAKSINALINFSDNIKDGDYSITLARGKVTEINDLIQRHNRLAQHLREERHNIHQRELILETILHSAPLVVLLADESKRIVYANNEARLIFGEDYCLPGQPISILEKSEKHNLGVAFNQRQNGIISFEDDETSASEQEFSVETYYLLNRDFSLQKQTHTLYIARSITQELSRQEVNSWKRLIRVISHELNNSLAPISSFAYSGNLTMDLIEESLLGTSSYSVLARQESWHGLRDKFVRIGDRAAHLKGFIERYAQFTRMPNPTLEKTSLQGLLQGLATQLHFDTKGNIDYWLNIDVQQIEQVLINLVKNAFDAGGEETRVIIGASQSQNDTRIIISDNGPGMSEAVLKSAQIPFYSTKPNGAGLGLAVCREILENHGGQISFRNVVDGGLDVTLSIPLKVNPNLPER